jgi:acyl dehydratase
MSLIRAALPSVPLVNRLPGVRKAPADGFTGLRRSRPPVTIEREHVERYAAVCGFPAKDTVPLTYPHLLAFGLHLEILGDQAFPAPAIGTVHVENSITAYRPIAVGETLAVEVTVGAALPHPKGTAYAFEATARSGDETVWESTSTYLRRGAGTGTPAEGVDLPEATPHGLTWRLPADLGRRYAAVSGDHNPIHLHPLTARALGFPRPIAHGMWSLARCVAAIENRLPDAVRVDTAFKKPIPLPGTVEYGVVRLDDGHAFSLSRPRDGAPHLLGRSTEM